MRSADQIRALPATLPARIQSLSGRPFSPQMSASSVAARMHGEGCPEATGLVRTVDAQATPS